MEAWPAGRSDGRAWVAPRRSRPRGSPGSSRCPHCWAPTSHPRCPLTSAWSSHRPRRTSRSPYLGSLRLRTRQRRSIPTALGSSPAYPEQSPKRAVSRSKAASHERSGGRRTERHSGGSIAPRSRPPIGAPRTERLRIDSDRSVAAALSLPSLPPGAPPRFVRPRQPPPASARRASRFEQLSGTHLTPAPQTRPPLTASRPPPASASRGCRRAARRPSRPGLAR